MRWSDETERLLQAAAETIGVSKAQFIREAILMRAILILDVEAQDVKVDLALLRKLSDTVRRNASDLGD